MARSGRHHELVRKDYAVDLRPDGSLQTEDEAALVPGSEWTPEHLLLAGLVNCSLESLRFHAKRAGVEVETASGSATAHIEKREGDGRFAIVDAGVSLEVRLVPTPDDPSDLFAKAERDCFVGASLTAKPRYTWTLA